MKGSIRFGELLIFIGSLFLFGQYAHSEALSEFMRADLIIVGGVGLLVCFGIAFVSRGFVLDEIVHIVALVIGAGLISLVVHRAEWGDFAFFDWGGPFSQSRSDTYPGSFSIDAATPKIEIKLMNGRVRIETANRSDYELRVSTRVRGWDDSHLKEMLDQYYLKPTLRDDGFSLTQATQTEVRRRGYSISNEVEITLPQSASYKIAIDSTNGRLTLENVRATELVLRTTNGSIRTENVSAESVEMSSNNGSLRGDLHVGSIAAKTTNGSIDLKLIPMADGSYVVTTTNGSIDLELEDKDAGYSVDADATNGRVRVELPGFNFQERSSKDRHILGRTDNFLTAEFQVDIRATTTNGSVKIEPQ